MLDKYGASTIIRTTYTFLPRFFIPPYEEKVATSHSESC
jgi:hypothetical protein